MSNPRENLVRECSVRAAMESDGNTLTGHFSVFDQWTEINSMFEGRFMERVAPGAFADTFRRNRNQMRVMFEHGKDPSIGNKPLGTIRTLREDGTGAFYEVDPIDRPYVDDVIAMARAGVLGASFRFSVEEESWVRSPEPSDHNPEGLDERTLQRLYVPEFGPVVWGAYDGATAMMRSATDQFRDQLANDSLFAVRFAERAPTVGPALVEEVRRNLAPEEREAETQEPAEVATPPADEAAAAGAESSPDERARRLWWAQRLQRI